MGLLVVASAALGVLFSFNPAASGLFPPCPFRALTGLLCPGCGTTRGFHQLLQGDLLTAIRLNPLMVLSLPFMIYAFFSQGVETLAGKRLPTVFLRPSWIWLLLGVIVLYGVVRNTPLYPAWFLR